MLKRVCEHCEYIYGTKIAGWPRPSGRCPVLIFINFIHGARGVRHRSVFERHHDADVRGRLD